MGCINEDGRAHRQSREVVSTHLPPRRCSAASSSAHRSRRPRPERSMQCGLAPSRLIWNLAVWVGGVFPTAPLRSPRLSPIVGVWERARASADHLLADQHRYTFARGRRSFPTRREHHRAASTTARLVPIFTTATQHTRFPGRDGRANITINNTVSGATPSPERATPHRDHSIRRWRGDDFSAPAAPRALCSRRARRQHRLHRRRHGRTAQVPWRHRTSTSPD